MSFDRDRYNADSVGDFSSWASSGPMLTQDIPNEQDIIDSQRMQELYNLYFKSQLDTPYYQNGIKIKPTGTSLFGGVGGLDTMGYEQMYGGSQNIGPVQLGFSRAKAMGDWRNKYSAGVNGKNWSASYQQGEGENPSKRYNLGGRIGKADVNLGYQRQGEYKGYDAEINGKLGKFDASISASKDNMGNKKIYAMLGRTF